MVAAPQGADRRLSSSAGQSFIGSYAGGDSGAMVTTGRSRGRCFEGGLRACYPGTMYVPVVWATRSPATLMSTSP
jgi:hypothetical protein